LRSVEPPAPVANKSFRLIFSADSEVAAEPDFNELEDKFEILGRNRQTSIQWTNGKNSRNTTWLLDVIVANVGELTIPSVAFGDDRSAMTQIKIAPNTSTTTAADDDSLLLEIGVDNESPYVQQQIILIARLLRRIELNDAKMTDPSTDGDAIIKRLGKDATFQMTRDGKPYVVFERRYSIFPQTSGELTIAPMTLTTQVVNSSRAFFDSFRQTVKTRRIESNALILTVKPIPRSYTGDTWLPAKRLRLRDDWVPDTTAATAGEPLTRTVVLWAEGLNAGQLPELAIGLPTGIKSYPDQPQTSEQQTDSGFSAVRQQNYAIIPNVNGLLEFPEIRVTWWNTDTDQMEIARLDKRQFNVAGSIESPMPNVTSSPQPNAVTLDDGALSGEEDIDGAIQLQNRGSYFVLMLVFLVGWLGTGLAWWAFSRRRAGGEIPPSFADTTTPTVARARKDVLGACKANDPRATKSALLRWGRVALKNPNLNTLGEIAKLVGEPLDREIRLLDETLYGNKTENWDQFSLHESFEHSDLQPLNDSELIATVNVLPTLNPLASR
jgi:hypothetical protein